jgi:Flavodoxin-like fold
VILASGSDFVTGMNRGRIDMATPYLREALRFIGVSDVRFALIGPTVGPAEPARLAREAAHRQLVEMAASFLTEALSVRAVSIYVHGSEVVSGGFWRPFARSQPSSTSSWASAC